VGRCRLRNPQFDNHGTIIGWAYQSPAVGRDRYDVSNRKSTLSAAGVAFDYVAEGNDRDFPGSASAVGVVRPFRLPNLV
jgi:hypothetical protein